MDTLNDGTYTKELLNRMENRRTFVSLTPYIRISKDERFRSNIFTTIDHTATEILSKVDVDAAIRFVEEAMAEVTGDAKENGRIPLYTEFLCELSFFVDKRARTQKDFTCSNKGDILSGVNCVTITAPTGERKTFVVNLDNFGDQLKELGYIVAFSSDNFSSEWLKDTVLRNGFQMTPKLDFGKKYSKDMVDDHHKL